MNEQPKGATYEMVAIAKAGNGPPWRFAIFRYRFHGTPDGQPDPNSVLGRWVWCGLPAGWKPLDETDESAFKYFASEAVARHECDKCAKLPVQTE